MSRVSMNYGSMNSMAPLIDSGDGKIHLPINLGSLEWY